jgi:hypothetical protein
MRSRRIGWAGHIVRVGQMRKALKIFIRKPSRNLSIDGTLWLIYLVTECPVVDWRNVAQDGAVVNTVVNRGAL